MTDIKVGILGGGQLGKMILMETARWQLPISILDKDASMPARPFTANYYCGSFNNYDDVLAFGQDKDILTVEIEHVNTDALRALRDQGKKVFPDPDTLDLIKDKGLQKEFYLKHKLPTPPAHFFNTLEDLKKALSENVITYPFVQKSRSFGYDGKGVAIIRSESDHVKLLNTSSIVEPVVDIKHEIAVIIARDEKGNSTHYTPVEMVFNETANLLDVLICPARISNALQDACIELSYKIADTYGIVGLLAIELFIDQEHKIWINEVAPRPHNSGHHTIENTYCSQYEQHIRAITGIGLGDSSMHSPAVMFNILGEPGHTGKAQVISASSVLKTPNAFLHWYGKTDTKPYRKMGHCTILHDDIKQALEQVDEIRSQLKVTAIT